MSQKKVLTLLFGKNSQTAVSQRSLLKRLRSLVLLLIGCKKNIVTDEDREKARLLDCNLDYNYLQELINKINKNPDLNVTIKTKDGATIHINAIPKQEDKDDLAFKELFVEVPKVK